MKKILLPLFLLLSFCLAGQVQALSLHEAKKQGLVGEQTNGMLGAVRAATPDVKALIKDINSRRQAAYSRIAAKNGTSVDAVRMLAGKKAIEKTPAGQYVKPGGEWVKAR